MADSSSQMNGGDTGTPSGWVDRTSQAISQGLKDSGQVPPAHMNAPSSPEDPLRLITTFVAIAPSENATPAAAPANINATAQTNNNPVALATNPAATATAASASSSSAKKRKRKRPKTVVELQRCYDKECKRR